MRRVGSVLILCLLSALQARSEVNRIVLRVNDRIATTYDYQRRRAESIAALQKAQSLTPEQRQEALARVGEGVMSELFDSSRPRPLLVSNPRRISKRHSLRAA
jgi:hypothetical protein